MYLYQQKEFFDDYGLNLHYFNARMFDSELGRFHSNDLLIIFASPYNGMGNNPVSLVDPSGMVPGFGDKTECSPHNGGIDISGIKRFFGDIGDWIGDNVFAGDGWGSGSPFSGGSAYTHHGGTNGVSNHTNYIGGHGPGAKNHGGTDNAGYTDNSKPRETLEQKVEREIDEINNDISELIKDGWTHKIKKDQTIYGVQMEYHWLFSRKEVQQRNPKVDLDDLKKGQEIIVPGPDETLINLPTIISPGTPNWKINIFGLVLGLLLDSPNSPLYINMKPGQGKQHRVYRDKNGNLFEWSMSADKTYIEIRYYANYHKFLGRWRGVYLIETVRRYTGLVSL